MGRIAKRIALILSTLFIIATSYPGIQWTEVEPYRYNFIIGATILAEVWAGDDAAWYWRVYLPTSFDGIPYQGKVCCKDEGIKKANDILVGGYLM